MKQHLDITHALFGLALQPTAVDDPLNSGAGPAAQSASISPADAAAPPSIPSAALKLQTNLKSPYAMAKQLLPSMHISPPKGCSPTDASSWGALPWHVQSRLRLTERYAATYSFNRTGGTDTLLAAVNSAHSVADLWSILDINDRIRFDRGQNIWDPSKSHVRHLAQQQQLGGKLGGRIITGLLEKIKQVSALQQQQQQQQGGDTGQNAWSEVSNGKIHFAAAAEVCGRRVSSRIPFFADTLMLSYTAFTSHVVASTAAC